MGTDDEAGNPTVVYKWALNDGNTHVLPAAYVAAQAEARVKDAGHQAHKGMLNPVLSHRLQS